MMLSELFEFIGKAVSVVAAGFAFYWAFERWRRQEEHFPRINFELEIEIIDQTAAGTIINIISVVENKGLVPLRIKDFICELRGLNRDDPLEIGDENIRHQLNFKNLLEGGEFIPKDWECSFVYPGVKTTYTFVTVLPKNVIYLLVRASFTYLDHKNTHHTGKIIRIPDSQLGRNP